MVGQAGDLAELVVHYDRGGERYENVFGFKALQDTSTLAQLATAFKTALVKNTSGGLLFNMLNTVTSSSLSVRDVAPGTAAGYDYAYTAVAGGTTSTDMLPPQAAAVISWRTALAGRSYRGRTYLPGMVESNQAAGLWTATVITGCEAIVTQMLAVFGPSGTDTNWQFCIISRYLNGAKRGTPVGTNVISGLSTTVVYTQRRRTIGRGI